MQLEELRPLKKSRLLDLLEETGLDVSDWANFSRGRKWAAANPKYCYEWAFTVPGKLVVLNLWYTQLRKRAGAIMWSGNPRQWFAPGDKAVWVKRAERFDRALQEAVRSGIPIRAIINDGTVRGLKDPISKPSTVRRRELDSISWAVTGYDSRTGQCTLTRGVEIVDQFALPESDLDVTERRSVEGTVFVRNPLLRDAALRRAGGKCEFCLQPGFPMENGRIFLETHHVVPLSEGGPDSLENVAAVCPNHHREAHHGSRATIIRDTLSRRIRSKQIDRVWLAEAKRRREELRSGAVQGVPIEQALRSVRDATRR